MVTKTTTTNIFPIPGRSSLYDLIQKTSYLSTSRTNGTIMYPTAISVASFHISKKVYTSLRALTP